MNILLLTNHLNRGGITSYILMLCEALMRTEHKVFVVTGGGDCEPELEFLGVPHYQLPINTSSELNPKLWIALKQLQKIIREEEIDVIHSHSRVGQILSSLVYRIRPCGRIFTCHGFFKPRIARRCLPLWGDRIIAISQPVKEHLLRDWKVSESMIRVIRHGVKQGVDPKEREAVRISAKKTLGLSENEIALGAVGRFSPIKGFHILIESMGELKLGRKRIRLFLVGQGREFRHYSQMVAHLGLEEQVLFVSDHNKKTLVMDACDIFCAPSLQEGLGLSILDAMRDAIPVIATRVGGIPDLIEHDKTGLLVSPGSAESLARSIELLAGDKELRRRLGEAGQYFVYENYPIEKMVELTLEAYLSIQPGKGGKKIEA